MLISLPETVLWSCFWNAVVSWDFPFKAFIVKSWSRFIGISRLHDCVHVQFDHFVARLSKGRSLQLFLFKIEIISIPCFETMSTVLSWWRKHALLPFAWPVFKPSWWSAKSRPMSCFLITHYFLKVCFSIVAHFLMDELERFESGVSWKSIDHLWLWGIYWTWILQLHL